MKRNLSAVGLAMALIIALGIMGCKGDEGPVPAPTNSAKITCMNTVDTCTQVAAAPASKWLAWLPDFISTAQADIVTNITTFQGANISKSSFFPTANISMLVENVGTETYTGYAYTDLETLFGGCGLVGGPISLAPGKSTTLLYGCGVANLSVGSYALSTYVYSTTANTGGLCDFTVENSNYWMIVQVRNWFQSCNPTPAAIGTLNFNVVL